MPTRWIHVGAFLFSVLIGACGGRVDQNHRPPADSPTLPALRPAKEPFRSCGHIGFGSSDTLAYAPNGQSVAVGSQYGYVKTFSVHDGSEQQVFALGKPTLEGTERSVSSISYSRDGTLVAVGDWSGGVSVFRVATGETVRTFSVPQYLFDVALSPDGQVLAVASTGKVQLRRVSDGSLLRMLDASITNDDGGSYGRPRRVLSFSPNGEYLVVGGLLSTRIWRVEDGVAMHSLSEGFNPVNAVSFSRDGNVIAAIGNTWLRVWRTSNGEEIAHAGLPDKSTADAFVRLDFMSDGQSILVARTSAVDFWRFRAGNNFTGSLVRSDGPKRSPDSSLYDVVISPDGQTLLTGELFGPVVLTDIPSSQRRVVISGFAGGARSLAFGAAGILLAGHQNTARTESYGVSHLWDTKTLRIVRSIDGTRGTSALSPTGRLLAVGLPQGGVAIYEPPDARAPRVVVPMRDAAYSVAFSKDESVLAISLARSVSAENAIVFLRTTDGSQVRTVRAPVGMLDALTLSPNVDAVAAAGQVGVFVMDLNNTVKLNVQVPTYGPRALAFHPSGTLLVTSSSDDGAPRYWRTRDWAELAGPKTVPDVGAVAFSPDGSILAMGEVHSRTHLVDISDGALVQTLDGLGTGATVNFAYSQDASQLAVAHQDGTLEMWCRP